MAIGCTTVCGVLPRTCCSGDTNLPGQSTTAMPPIIFLPGLQLDSPLLKQTAGRLTLLQTERVQPTYRASSVQKDTLNPVFNFPEPQIPSFRNPLASKEAQNPSVVELSVPAPFTRCQYHLLLRQRDFISKYIIFLINPPWSRPSTG